MAAQSWDSVPPAPGVNAQDCIAGIVFAAEHQFEFNLFDLCRNSFQIGLDLCAYGLVIFLNRKPKSAVVGLQVGRGVFDIFLHLPAGSIPVVLFFGRFGDRSKNLALPFLLEGFRVLFLYLLSQRCPLSSWSRAVIPLTSDFKSASIVYFLSSFEWRYIYSGF